MVVSNFSNQLLSANLNDGCRIKLTIQFYVEKGAIQAQYYNASENTSRSLGFNVIMTWNQTEFRYEANAHHVCSFNKSCNQPFIKDWISDQRNAINKYIQLEKKANFSFINVHLWKVLNQNETDLCFHISFDQNLSGQISHWKGSIDQRLRCLNQDKNITNCISPLVIKLNGLITLQDFSNNEMIVIKQISAAFFNTTQPIDGYPTASVNPSQANENQDKNLLIIIIIVLAFILLVVTIACCLCWNAHRRRYHLTSTS